MESNRSRGLLIINADDWGGWEAATNAAFACYQRGRITSASAMVFMADSQRAAALAKSSALDVGLHLNFTQPFSACHCPDPVVQAQTRTRRFLKSSRYALLVYHPFLREEFRLLYQAQLKEFRRLYGTEPSHIDGHQHLHLCANLVFGRIIPPGQKVRRSFSFWPGEKGWLNRYYRARLDHRLGRRYRITDYFFSLNQCIKHQRLKRVAELSKQTSVELMTHPERRDEFEWLTDGGFDEMLLDLPLGSYARL